MKRVIFAVAAIAASVSSASAQYYNYGTGSNPHDHYVSPHMTRDGDYVGGHYQTNPNGTTHDNYGAGGNYNYHTGRTGSGY